MANAIEDRLAAIETEKEALLKLKNAGVTDPSKAVKDAVALVSHHLEEAKRLSEAFGIGFSLPVDHKAITYYPSHKTFIDNDDGYGWSSSSLGC